VLCPEADRAASSNVLSSDVTNCCVFCVSEEQKCLTDCPVSLYHCRCLYSRTALPTARCHCITADVCTAELPYRLSDVTVSLQMSVQQNCLTDCPMSLYHSEHCSCLALTKTRICLSVLFTQSNMYCELRYLQIRPMRCVCCDMI